MQGLFISHGSPTILIEKDNKWRDVLKRIGQKLKELKPDVLLLASPHFISWSGINYVEVGERLECIQDYYGFPDETYKYCYSAENDVELAKEIAKTANIKPDQSWGLDHGAWIPLYFMFEGEKVKAVTISITTSSPEDHYQIGEKVREAVEKLGRKAVFIATGSPTHRLDLFYFKIPPRQTRFDRILIELINKGDFNSILKIKELYPKEYMEAQPEGDLNTLYMLLGFVKPKKGEVLAYDVPWAGVSMLAAAFD